MNKQYEVTIGIPLYKSAKYIEKSLLSALNQTFQYIEFLIVDDAGNDGSKDIVFKLQRNHPRGRNIRIIANDKNMGVSFSRNRIIDEAKGRFLYFMDSDDTIEPDTIQLLYDSLTFNHSQIAFGSYEIIDDINHNPSEVYQKDALVLNGADQLAMYAFKNNNIFHVSVCNHLIDILFLRQLGLKFINSSYWEDLDYITDLVVNVERAVLLSNITYHYYRHSDSLSHYQSRHILGKDEIDRNLFVLRRVKRRCKDLKGKQYIPYLCYNLEMISFYAACNIIHNYHSIFPRFTFSEIRDVMRHPMSLKDIINCKSKKIVNLLFWLLGISPIAFFLPIIWIIGKYKRSL